MRAELGVDDLLLVVQAVIAGQHVADGTSYGEQKYSVRSEQLYAQEQRCKRTVYHATEEAHHSEGSGKARVESHESTHDASKCGTDEERWNDLTASESTAYCYGGKQRLEKESRWFCFSVERLGDDVHTGSVVVGGVEYYVEQDEHHASCEYAHILVLEIFAEKLVHNVHEYTEQTAEHCAQDSQTDDLDHQRHIHGCRHAGYIVVVVYNVKLSCYGVCYD